MDYRTQVIKTFPLADGHEELDGNEEAGTQVVDRANPSITKTVKCFSGGNIVFGTECGTISTPMVWYVKRKRAN